MRAAAHELVPPTDGVVALGRRVEIHDAGPRDVFQLAASCETNIGGGCLSIVSPLGRALLGHAAGEEVVRLPVGLSDAWRVVAFDDAGPTADPHPGACRRRCARAG